MLRLPVDLSTFSELRKQNYLYVDKTKYAYDLILGGRRFFLSRPRRFGKTLFVSTLKEILLGNKHLFENLWISQSDYDWQKYGLITLDLSVLDIEDANSLKIGLKEGLIRVYREYGLELNSSIDTPQFILYDLVKALKKKYGKVALLIDEYDYPILHSLKNNSQASVIRDGISKFFAGIKGLDAELDFVFITGVSNFAKAGLFSGLNNLQIISLDKSFSAVCGYTEEEIKNYFSEHIEAWVNKDKINVLDLINKIKYWYNGYRFSKNSESVYNPFSLMKSLDSQEFKNFWFQSGAPTFLIEELKQEYRKPQYPILKLDNFEITEDSLGIFDVGTTPLPSLMFQTGYLTITDYNSVKNLYTLGYPNYEVKTALQKNILSSLTNLDIASTEQISNKLRDYLNEGDVEHAVAILKQLFFNVPYLLHIKKEKFYHALLQMACDVAGIKIQSEYLISHGRIDAKLELPNYIYIIEIKFNKSAEEALQQIEERKYHEAFIRHGKPIILLGLSFNREPKYFDIEYKEKRVG